MRVGRSVASVMVRQERLGSVGLCLKRDYDSHSLRVRVLTIVGALTDGTLGVRECNHHPAREW